MAWLALPGGGGPALFPLGGSVRRAEFLSVRPRAGRMGRPSENGRNRGADASASAPHRVPVDQPSWTKIPRAAHVDSRGAGGDARPGTTAHRDPRRGPRPDPHHRRQGRGGPSQRRLRGLVGAPIGGGRRAAGLLTARGAGGSAARRPRVGRAHGRATVPRSDLRARSRRPGAGAPRGGHGARPCARGGARTPRCPRLRRAPFPRGSLVPRGGRVSYRQGRNGRSASDAPRGRSLGPRQPTVRGGRARHEGSYPAGGGGVPATRAGLRGQPRAARIGLRAGHATNPGPADLSADGPRRDPAGCGGRGERRCAPPPRARHRRP